jgi:hypothetical protein
MSQQIGLPKQIRHKLFSPSFIKTINATKAMRIFFTLINLKTYVELHRSIIQLTRATLLGLNWY